MMVVNYVFNDMFGNNEFFWVGFEWFDEMVYFLCLYEVLGWQVLFFVIILVIEVLLGIFVVFNMLKKGFWVSLVLVFMVLLLLILFNVVGMIWQIFGCVDIGFLGCMFEMLGIDYNYINDLLDVWIIVVVMDVWYWISFVVLFCYVGL